MLNKESHSTAILIATASVSLLTGAFLSYRYQHRVIEQWMERRQEERRGRIRAEQKLRTTIKQEQKQQNQQTIIGHIVSPYTKRMGTPRQPQLVPSSRGYLDVNGVPPESLQHIDAYSHVWILFIFHANTNVENRKSKIRPPRAPYKVGQLATRSPHRPNPIGLSLVKVVEWDAKKRRLYLAGLDLVHGTPVLDIKPVVPWDIPQEALVVPEWVRQEDSLQNVIFEQQALEGLLACIQAGHLAPLYTGDNQGYEAALQTLHELLLTDPRSSHKGLKSNQRGSNSQDTYNLIFGQTRVDFCVQNGVARVLGVEAVEFDPESFVEGIPVIGM